jgi:hypothetical protein
VLRANLGAIEAVARAANSTKARAQCRRTAALLPRGRAAARSLTRAHTAPQGKHVEPRFMSEKYRSEQFAIGSLKYALSCIHLTRRGCDVHR